MKLIITASPSGPRAENETVMSENSFKTWFLSSRSIGNFFRYKKAEYYIHDINRLRFNAAIALKAVTRGPVTIIGSNGESRKLSFPGIFAIGLRYTAGLLRKRKIMHRVERMILALKKTESKNALCAGSPLYIRSDLIFGLKGGGSVGHIAGVVNNLAAVTGATPLFLSSDFIPTVDENISTLLINPSPDFVDDPEFDMIFYNIDFLKNYRRIIGSKAVSFVYQRYSLNNFCGAQVAHDLSVPFVLEYNGSEIWVSKNWGKKLRYETMAERIEMLNLNRADLIVVVSAPMKDELISRGISAGKILVNPNGVNPQMYRPDIDGSEIRQRYNLHGKTVIGFIGTFGKWHGADILAHAYDLLLRENRHLSPDIALMMIGDGPTMPEVREILKNAPNVVFAGTVPQAQGPEHLAACDILVASHRPNDDGTPFFGSPTKLFEYMAMGKSIVASDLDQIGEILQDNHTALMVTPGDYRALHQALLRLIGDPDLRHNLGINARQEVIAHYTWEMHTRKIYDKLSAVVQ